MCWFGQILIGSRDCRGGVTYAEKVLAVDPKHLVANNVLSLAAFQCKDYEKAFWKSVENTGLTEKKFARQHLTELNPCCLEMYVSCFQTFF